MKKRNFDSCAFCVGSRCPRARAGEIVVKTREISHAHTIKFGWLIVKLKTILFLIGKLKKLE